MTSKKRRHNVCVLHSDRRAHGVCSACGKHLCRECSLVAGGTCYCFAPECRPETLRLVVKEEPRGLAAVWKLLDPPLRRLIAGSSVTVALCGIVFAAWTLREVYTLYTENSTLRASRLALIEQLKNSNRELRNLEVSAPPPDSDRADTTQRTASGAEPYNRSNSAAMPYHPADRDNRSFPFHFPGGPTAFTTVALTFDGSSFANVAGEVLDTLASRGVTATMFLTGEFIRKFPDLTRRIVAEGHECGNHTFNHPHLTGILVDHTSVTLPAVNKAFLVSELLRADDLFTGVTGKHFAPLWRAPYGEYNRELCRWAFDAGFLHIGWRQGRTWREGLDSNDWIPDTLTPGFHTPAEFIEKTVSLARRKPDGINGGIVLLHLGTERRDPAMQVHRVLGTLIDTLRAEGYRFVTVAEMAASAGIGLASLEKRIHIQ